MTESTYENLNTTLYYNIKSACNNISEQLSQHIYQELILSNTDTDNDYYLSRYKKMRNGFIKAQAQFRMMRQRKKYLKMREELKRKQQYLGHDGDMSKKHLYNYDSGKQVSFNLLDIPPELAFIYSKLDDWEDIHMDRNIIISSSHANPLQSDFQLPSDINSFTFNKFIQIYIKDNWERMLTPLAKPFLSKLNLLDVQESLAIFKMILRCVNSNEYDTKRDKVLIDYIIQKGLINVNLRDEIFIQIINQTWNNDDRISNRKAWELMACCLSAFPPSPYLYKYLLKYASDHAVDAYKAYCQKKLLECENIESQLARTYPPSHLEWKATTKCANLALETNLSNHERTVTQVESWTTGEEFSKASLKNKDLEDFELNGWTVTLHDDNDWYELMGNDYVLDLISEMEVPPAFPVCKSFFLVSTDMSKEATCQQKRRSMTAGSNNPDSVYDWYFEMHQTANSTDRLVLTKAIKGNSSNRQLDMMVSNSKTESNSTSKIGRNIEKTSQTGTSTITATGSNVSNSTNGQVTTTTLSNNNITGNQKVSSTNQRLVNNKTSMHQNSARAPAKKPVLTNNKVAIKRPDNQKLENNHKNNLCSSSNTSIHNSKKQNTVRNAVMHFDGYNKSLKSKRSSKQRMNLQSDSKTRMYTLNKSKKGTICSSRKQNFRFRFEPNKSTLTRIDLKDSVKSRSITTADDLSSVKVPKQHSNSGYLMNKENRRNSDKYLESPKEKRSRIRKNQENVEDSKMFGAKAYSSQIYGTHLDNKSDSSDESVDDTSNDVDEAEGHIVPQRHKIIKSENPKYDVDIKTKIAELSSKIRTEENKSLNERKERVTLSKVSKLNTRYIKKSRGNEVKSSSTNNIANKVLKSSLKSNFQDSSSSSFSNLRSNSSGLLSKSSALNERYLKNVDSNNPTSSKSGNESVIFSDISEANTIKQIPIPSNKSDVEAFLDDIFDRALDVNMRRRNMRLKALQKRIKGGGNANLTNIDGQHSQNESHNDCLVKACTEVEVPKVEYENEENEWFKVDDDHKISFICNFDYKASTDCSADRYLIIPDQEYEYTKIVRIFLKDKENLLKLNNGFHENDNIKNNFRDGSSGIPLSLYPKINFESLKNSRSVDNCPYLGTSKNLKPLNENTKEFFEPSYYHDSLEFHQQLFQNNWNVLLDIYNFCKYESGSMSSTGSDSSILSSLSNSGYSSSGSTKSTSLRLSSFKSWSSFSFESTNSCDEFKMYVDSIGLTANREIIIKGSLSDKIKGGVEKPEPIVDLGTRKNLFQKTPFIGYYPNSTDQDTLIQNSTNIIIDNGNVPVNTYSPPVIPFVDPTQVALMQAVYTQLAQQQQFLLQHKDGKQNPVIIKKPILTNTSPQDTRYVQKLEVVDPIVNNRRDVDISIEDGKRSSSSSSAHSMNTSHEESSASDSEWRINGYNSSIPPAPPLPPPPQLMPKLKPSLSDLQGRAKTVRIGKVRWPPPLKEKETFEKELARRLELQRKIHEEILAAAEKLEHGEMTLSDIKNEAAKFSKLIELKKQEDDQASAIKKIEDKIRCFEDKNNEKSLNESIAIDNNFRSKNLITETKMQQIILKNSNQLDPSQFIQPPNMTTISYLSNFQANQDQFVNQDGNKIDLITAQNVCAAGIQQAYVIDSLDNTRSNQANDSLPPIPSPLPPFPAYPPYPPIVQESTSSKHRSQSYEESLIETKLLEQTNTQTYVYTKIQWSLHIRKEVFSPTEKIETPTAIDLVFLQIIKDYKSSHCIRLSDADRTQLKNFIENKSLASLILTQQYDCIKTIVKKQIIEIAKDWPLYFSRLFPVAGSKQYSNVQILGISHSGIRLIKRERNPNQDMLVSIEHYSLWDVREVVVPKGSTIHLIVNRSDKKITLYSHRANQIKKMIDAYCAELDQESKFVQAVRDYITNEDTSLLSFRKGDIIKLLHKSYTPHGWLRGILNGRKGVFPVEYVRPIARSELYDLNKNNDSFSNEQSIDKGYPLLTTILDDLQDECQSPTNLGYQDGYYSMMEFAMMNFRQSIDKYTVIDKIKSPVLHGSSNVLQKLRDSRLSSANARDWNWSDYAQMVKFSKSPITASLLKFDRQELSQMAVDCFIEIMRFMGDYPLAKGQKDIDCIYFLLQTLHHHSELCDEVYCQLMKQTTNNKSTKTESCQKGWRLMAIITAYFKSSDLLKPYLFKYLENNAYDTKRPYNAVAQICLTSLRKTFKYGGRRNVPSQIELDALITGRISKRQMFLLPGGVPILLNIRSCTVVQDCIEQICGHLGVQNPLEQYEFAIYYVVEAEKAARPLNRCEYIFDVITELTKLNNEFYLIFKRILWHFPLRLESDGYIDMMYNQILPDYGEGLVVVTHMNKLNTNQNSDIALLAALQYRANDKVGLPSMREVKHLLPVNVLDLKDLKPQQWVSLIHMKLRQIEHFTVTQAKTKFLEVLQSWPLFGSTFFYVKNIYDSRIHGDCILAINKLGVHFLNKESHESTLSFTFNEVISTRRYRGENNLQFVDLKCGNLMVQKVTRIETDQGNEISILIGQYIDLINRYQENYKQLGPYTPHTTVYNGQDITTTFL